MTTEICPCCGVSFVAHRNWPFVDDTGTTFCCLECQTQAGIFAGDTDTEDLFTEE